MQRLPSLVGQTFERWTVLAEVQSSLPPRCRRRYLCRCSCGTEQVIVQDQLTTGHTRSCGCLKKELQSRLAKKHGESQWFGDTKEYRAWNNMRVRCYQKKNPAYKNYGGRGITMCDRWRNSYEAFLADVGRAPSPDLTLDRFPDNNGNYEPGNVRWATWFEQAANRRPRQARKDMVQEACQLSQLS